jgi:hypothetical protein
LILAIDPGSVESAYVVLDENLKPVEFGKWENHRLAFCLTDIIIEHKIKYVAIEMIASYGMAVGESVFNTCVWVGRLTERAHSNTKIDNLTYIYRKDEKMNLCHTMKAKDGNIRQALIDRFGVVGTKNNKGWFYGVSKDVWAAIAVGVTYHDMYLNKKAVG